MHFISHILDAMTMYRVVIYSLFFISFGALVLSVAGVLAIAPLALLLSFCIIVGAAMATHVLVTYAAKAPANIESSFITALILFLVVTPSAVPLDLAILGLMAVLAICLKYVVRFRLRHIFNPVALILVLMSFAGYYGAEWWVGSRYLLPIVLVAALAVVMKTRRYTLVFTYVLASTVFAALAFMYTTPIAETIVRHFISWPTIFFAVFMLTEPLGLPSTKRLQVVYAVLAAALSSVPFSIGVVHGTPELALLIVNALTLITDAPSRMRLQFLRKVRAGESVTEYIFLAEQMLQHKPGQYLEWTLVHKKPDVRGIRRYFTIASTPESREVSFAVRHSDRQSTFKTELQRMGTSAVVYATQRAGDFTLRPNAKHHVFIAGGIGVTPFMSMIRTAALLHTPLPATLFYCNRTKEDIAFLDEISHASELGVRPVHVLSEPAADTFPHEVGYITAGMLVRYVPVWAEATFYISGPSPLVDSYVRLLRTLKIPSRKIVVDYFPGLA